MDYECDKCGADVAVDQKFCSKCGIELVWETESAQTTSSLEGKPVEQNKLQERKPSSSRRRQFTPFGYFLVCLVLVAVGTGVFLALKVSGVIMKPQDNLIIALHYKTKPGSINQGSKRPCDNIPSEFTDLFTPVGEAQSGSLDMTYGSVNVNLFNDKSGSATNTYSAQLTGTTTTTDDITFQGNNFEYQNGKNECIYFYSFIVPSLNNDASIDMWLGERQIKHYKISEFKKTPDVYGGRDFALNVNMNPNTANGNWYPKDYTLFNYSSVAYKWVGGLRCGVALYGCSGISVITNFTCANGIFGELTELDSTGAQIGYSLRDTGALSQGEKANLVFDYDRNNVASVRLTKLDCR